MIGDDGDAAPPARVAQAQFGVLPQSAEAVVVELVTDEVDHVDLLAGGHPRIDGRVQHTGVVRGFDGTDGPQADDAVGHIREWFQHAPHATREFRELSRIRG